MKKIIQLGVTTLLGLATMGPLSAMDARFKDANRKAGLCGLQPDS